MELNSKTAIELIENESFVVIDFMSNWCGPCKTLSPIIDNLSEKYSDKVKVIKINIDDNNEITNKYQIMSIPTLLFFKNGKQIDKSVGMISVEKLTEKFENLIKN